MSDGDAFHWSDTDLTLEDGTPVYVCTDYRKDYYVSKYTVAEGNKRHCLIVVSTAPEVTWSSGVGRQGVFYASDGLPWSEGSYALQLPLRKGPSVIEDWRL